MGASDLFLPILLLVVMAVAYQSFKIANENERFAVFHLGRFYKFKGLGLVFKTNRMKLVRLRIGDVVRILSFNDSLPFLTRSDETPSRHCPNCGHEFQGT